MKPMFIKNQAEFDKLPAKLTPGMVVFLQPGKYIMKNRLELDGAHMMSSNPHTLAEVRYEGPLGKPNDVRIFKMWNNARVANLIIDPNGMGCFDVRGNMVEIACNQVIGSARTRDFVYAAGQSGLRLINNYCWSVDGYFAYICGIDGRPSAAVTISGNVCMASTDSHIVRFHDVIGAEMSYNYFQYPKSTCILKGHDGWNWIIHNNKSFNGIWEFGPLDGQDGGLHPKDAARRDMLLAKKLDNVQFYENTLEQCEIHLVPGVNNISIYNNMLNNVRDTAIQYFATRTQKDRVTQQRVVYDYRPYRGESAGTISDNIVLPKDGVTKPPYGSFPKSLHLFA